MTKEEQIILENNEIIMLDKILDWISSRLCESKNYLIQNNFNSIPPYYLKISNSEINFLLLLIKPEEIEIIISKLNILSSVCLENENQPEIDEKSVTLIENIIINLEMILGEPNDIEEKKLREKTRKKLQQIKILYYRSNLIYLNDNRIHRFLFLILTRLLIEAPFIYKLNDGTLLFEYIMETKPYFKNFFINMN